MARGGAAKEDPKAKLDALRAVSEAPARLRSVLPRVDLISSAEVARLTHRLYHTWNACLRALRESGAPVPGDDTFPWQEAWPAAYSALREELLRWNVETVYEHLRERMRLELGFEHDSDPAFFTPDELRARVEAFAAYMDRDE